MSRAINYEVFIGPTKLQQDSSLATRDPFSLYHIIHLSLFHHVSITTAGPMRPVVMFALYFKRVAISIPLQKQSESWQIFFKYFAIFLTCQRENVLTYIVSRILVSK